MFRRAGRRQLAKRKPAAINTVRVCVTEDPSIPEIKEQTVAFPGVTTRNAGPLHGWARESADWVR